MKAKKWLMGVFAFALTCSVFAAAGCTKSHNSSDHGTESTSEVDEYISSDWTVMPENTNGNLKYFGYFHSDGFLSQGSYIDEIAALGNANVLMVNSSFSTANTLEKLGKAREYGMKVILSVHGLFTGGKQGKVGSSVAVENYESVWEEMSAPIEEFIEDGTILAFYFDEPAWNGIGEEDFRKVTSMLRRTYPDTRVMTTMMSYDLGIGSIEGYGEINASYNEFCTDVMYDNYSAWNDEVRRNYLDRLKSKATNGQWIWGCPKGFSDNPEMTGVMEDHIKGMYTEAIQEPRYAGIISFSYADGFEGDWGYGLHSFFDYDSDYYNREFRHLYVNIGREIIGLDPIDFNDDVEIRIDVPSEVYELGEKISLPPAGATDGAGNEIAVEYEIVSPSGEKLENKSFIAEESGVYTITVSVGEGEGKVSRESYISVRYPDEISLFDNKAYLSDAGGSEADIWCWPKQIDATFSHSGSGSLKVTPHATDGTWPRIIFNRNGNQLWDLTGYGYISMFVYNTSDEVINGFALMVADENDSKSSYVYAIEPLPAKEWTEVRMSVATIRATMPTLDVTKVMIMYGNAASDYKNRCDFYVDDVTFLPEDEDKGQVDTANGIFFDSPDSQARLGGTADDVWGWPRAVDTTFAYNGTGSLKVTPHPTDCTWPRVFFNPEESEKWDLTNAESVSIYVYNTSESAIEGFALMVSDGAKTYYGTVSLASKTWTEVKVTTAAIKSAEPALDLANVSIFYGNAAADYKDRSAFYVDDFIVAAPEDPQTPDEPVESNEYKLAFENSADLGKIGKNADDVWTWPYDVSGEQSHSGEKSLKVTVRQDGGVWPNVVFLPAEGERFDLTNVEYISMYIYFDSADAFGTLGYKVNNGTDNVAGRQATKIFDIPSRTWTELKISVAEIKALAADIDLADAKICFSQLGGTYDDRSNFYIDDFTVTYKSGEEQPVTAANSIDFESAECISRLGGTADDVWGWPRTIDNSFARTGDGSLKITPHPTDCTWPRVFFNPEEGEKWDLSEANSVSIWVYNTSESAIEGFALMISDGTKTYYGTVSLASKTWTEVKVTTAAIKGAEPALDLVNVSIFYGNAASGYNDRSVFYIDDFVIEK